MSRLIDADTLKKDIARLHVLNDEAEIRRTYEYNPHVTTTDFEETLVSVFDAIDEAPTIGIDRPQGEWVTEYNGTGWNDYWDYTCTNCKMKFPRADDVLHNAHYCPSCGAQMKGADDE